VNPADLQQPMPTAATAAASGDPAGGQNGARPAAKKKPVTR
jgi:hypothetical protein